MLYATVPRSSLSAALVSRSEQHDQDAHGLGYERLDRLALTRLGERRAFVRPGHAVMLPSCASWFREPTADRPAYPFVTQGCGGQSADWFLDRIITSSLTVSKTTANIPIKPAEALSENPASAQLFRSCQSQLVLLRFPTIRKKILRENNPPI